MISSSEPSHANVSIGYPGEWNDETLRTNWTEYLAGLIKENDSSLPLKRIQYQLEQSSDFQEITKRWSKMSAGQRVSAWRSLLESSEKALQEVLPTCVQCGECCRLGSPTLHMDDLSLLRSGKIQWSQLLTLRRGEPVKSEFEDKPFFLLDERIKIREKAGTRECTFFDATTDSCSIYADRPMQCRAQACWDPEPSKDLSKHPYLTRRDIFEGVELLLSIIGEHDRRCAFEKITEAFRRLEESRGKTVDEVLELMSYEDHFRSFFSQKLNVPDDNIELVFGRSFADIAPLFGFKVVNELDGKRCLVLDE